MPYIGRGSDFGVRSVFHFLASNGDTSVSGADADGKNLSFVDGTFIDVYLNGVRLKLGEDYNTNTANTVAGLSALNANDEVNVVVYDTFTVADTVKASEGGAFAGRVNFTGGVGGSGGNLVLKNTDTTDDSSPTFTLQTGDTDIAADDVLGTINFQAPDEGTGTDAILVAASIEAVSEGDFSSSSNATKLSFKTGSSETATEKMSLSSGGQLTITRADNGTQLLLQSTDADANVGPLLDLNRDSGSPADSDFLGKIQFSADDDGGNKLNYAFIDSKILDASNGSEDGQIDISTIQGGSAISRLQFNTATVFNEDSADVDFRVESNGQTHALFVDAGSDHVNINTDTDLGSTLNVNGDITVANADSGLILVENAADAFGSNIALRKSRNTTLNAHTVVQDDDALGTISFQGSDGDEFVTGASLSSKVDFTPGNDDLGARLEVAISRDGTKTTAINSIFHSFNSADNTKLQSLAVGYNASGGNYTQRGTGLHAGAHRYYHGGIVVEDYDSSTQYAGTAIQFYRNGSNVGSIETQGSSTAYNTSSDYRLKKEIADLDTSLGIETIKKLKPRKYKWVSNDTHFDYGFVAHEVQDAIPNASDIAVVLGQKDETEVAKYVVLDASGNILEEKVSEEKWIAGKSPTKDEDGKEVAAKYPSDSTWKETTTKPKYQGIDYGRFTPILVKGLQEAVTRIETLETKVKTLEGG